jgi:transcription elongation factor GreA
MNTMPEKQTFLTREGKAKLLAEMEFLRHTKRPEVTERIHQAIEQGTSDDNAELEAAKNEQAFVEGRIHTLENLLASATLIDSNHAAGEAIRLGSTVTVRDQDGSEVVWTIVGSAEASPKNGRISNESPVGRALMGRKSGEKVTVQVPAGATEYAIVAVS